MNINKPVSKDEAIRQYLISRGILQPCSEPTKTTRCLTVFRDREGKETGRCNAMFEQLVRDYYTICPRCAHPHMFRKEE